MHLVSFLFLCLCLFACTRCWAHGLSFVVLLLLVFGFSSGFRVRIDQEWFWMCVVLYEYLGFGFGDGFGCGQCCREMVVNQEMGLLSFLLNGCCCSCCCLFLMLRFSLLLLCWFWPRIEGLFVYVGREPRSRDQQGLGKSLVLETWIC